MHTFAAQWLAPRIGAFQLRHPQIAVRLETTQRVTFHKGKLHKLIVGEDANGKFARYELEGDANDPAFVDQYILLALPFAEAQRLFGTALRGLNQRQQFPKDLRRVAAIDLLDN